MNLEKIVERFSGITVNIVTTNPAAAFAAGQIVDVKIAEDFLTVKLTAPFANFPTGATVFFNVEQIVAIG